VNPASGELMCPVGCPWPLSRSLRLYQQPRAPE
jgi:hypothetical protein